MHTGAKARKNRRLVILSSIVAGLATVFVIGTIIYVIFGMDDGSAGEIAQTGMSEEGLAVLDSSQDSSVMDPFTGVEFYSKAFQLQLPGEHHQSLILQFHHHATPLQNES